MHAPDKEKCRPLSGTAAAEKACDFVFTRNSEKVKSVGDIMPLVLAEIFAKGGRK